MVPEGGALSRVALIKKLDEAKRFLFEFNWKLYFFTCTKNFIVNNREIF